MSAANAKPDQLRPVPRHNVNKENESYEDTEPRHCRKLLLWAGLHLNSFFSFWLSVESVSFSISIWSCYLSVLSSDIIFSGRYSPVQQVLVSLS